MLSGPKHEYEHATRVQLWHHDNGTKEDVMQSCNETKQVEIKCFTVIIAPPLWQEQEHSHVFQCTIELHFITLLYIRLHYSRADLCCFPFVHVMFD